MTKDKGNPMLQSTNSAHFMLARRLGVWSVVILLSLVLGPWSFAASSRPNIIIILADDLGYGDLSCYGQTKYKTPHLDRMAAEGARLTQFNTPAPFCAPTRASLMTGRYPFRCGMVANPAPDGGDAAHKLHLPASEVLLPELLKKAGYRTGMVGKWHLGHAEPRWLPTHRGFDEYFGIPYSNDMRPVALFEGDKQVEYPVIQANLTKRYTERAVAFIEKNRRRPFFLYFPHAMPHKPLAASEAFYKKSGGGLYGDAVAELDWSVGQVLAKLKELKLDENTLVMFTSDNGATFGGSTGGLRGMKGSSYEGGYRVPMIARWPGKIPAGHTSAEPGIMMDLFATALAAANVAPPKGVVIDGRDLLPVLTSSAKSPHAAIFGHQATKLACVRDARWKLHVLKPGEGLANVGKTVPPGERYKDPRGPDGVTIIAPYEQAQPTDHPGLRTGDAPKAMQLFNLLNDPGEQRDVAAQHPDVVARLKQLFEAMNKDVPDDLPNPKRTGPNPK
jgi:arylsulfatase A-like enzyme